MTQSIVLWYFGYMSDVGEWKFLRSAECLCSHSKFNVGCYVNIVIELCELLSVISSILSNYLTLPCFSLDMCPGPKVRSTLNISAVWWLKTHVRKLVQPCHGCLLRREQPCCRPQDITKPDEQALRVHLYSHFKPGTHSTSILSMNVCWSAFLRWHVSLHVCTVCMCV